MAHHKENHNNGVPFENSPQAVKDALVRSLDGREVKFGKCGYSYALTPQEEAIYEQAFRQRWLAELELR